LFGTLIILEGFKRDTHDTKKSCDNARGFAEVSKAGLGTACSRSYKVMNASDAPTLTEKIARYVCGLRYGQFPPDVSDYAKRILLDSLACLYGGLNSAPARMVRATVVANGRSSEATMIGAKARTSAQHAALANGVAIRYQDYNDVYFGPAWTAHPSDNLATLLAVAETRHASGKDFLTAMVTAYEVQMRFSDLPVPRNLWHRGWHHTAACSYASAAGVARLMGLNATRTANAIALAGARANTFSEIRHGKIPYDKALSAPMVASMAIFYAQLAQQGFTGCLTLLEGPYGFKHAVAGGVDVAPLLPQAGDYRILKVGLKPYPVEGMTPAMVEAALVLREKHGIRPHEVQAIRILAHEEAVTKPSWDTQKLVPDSKETADHSFHYCVAAALVAGEVTSKQFERRYLRNKQIHALIGKTILVADARLTALFKQGARPAALEITTARGSFYHETLYPLGDPKNPMTWRLVEEKFFSQATTFTSRRYAKKISERVAQLESEADMHGFMKRLARAVRPGDR
jgi:2-methylcitrate dehydratase